MAKKIDIVQAFVWASNILDTEQLTLAEQATLFNLIKLINRNFWKPIKISAFKLARVMCSDQRTIKKTLKSLADKNIIHFNVINEIKLEGDIFIGNISKEHFQSLISQQDNGGHNGESVGADVQHGISTANATESTTNAQTNSAGSKTLADF